MVKRHLPAVLLLLVLLFAMTYPLPFRLTTHVPAFWSTMETPGVIGENWRGEARFPASLLMFRTDPLIAYPFGRPLYEAGFVPFLGFYLNYFLVLLTSPVLAWNLTCLVNMLLSGIIMYLLVLKLTKSRIAGIFSGIAFAFCPYQFARLWQHRGLTFNELLPLTLLSAILLMDTPSKRIKVLFVTSLVLLYSFDFHIMLFGSFLLFLLIAYRLWFSLRARQYNALSPAAYGLGKFWLVSFAVLSLQFLPVLITVMSRHVQQPPSGFNLYHREFADLFTQSAKPLSYFLPSTEHPLFGGFTAQFAGSGMWGCGFTEHQLFLGFTVMALCLVAFRRRREEPFYTGFFAFVALAAWIFSQPPYWSFGFIKIYFPSFFLHKILPMLRGYCRFGIVVMLACSVLAGLGLASVLKRIRSQSLRLLTGGLFCCLILFEFWNYPPFKVLNVSRAPAVYSWIRQQPGRFAVAEYPLDLDGQDMNYLFYQKFHGRPMINGTAINTYANDLQRSIASLSEPGACGVLAWLGVRYVVVHEQSYLDDGRTDMEEELKKIPSNPGLRLVQAFPGYRDEKELSMETSGPIDLYEVIAQPIAPRKGG